MFLSTNQLPTENKKSVKLDEEIWLLTYLKGRKKVQRAQKDVKRTSEVGESFVVFTLFPG